MHLVLSDATKQYTTLLNVHHVTPTRDGCDRYRLYPHARHWTHFLRVCVYYCRTHYKAVRGGEEDSGGHVL